MAKVVAKKIKAEDDWADDGKCKQPNAGTDGKGDRCPGKLPVKVSVTDKSYGAAEGDGSHREEVCVCNQVANQS